MNYNTDPNLPRMERENVEVTHLLLTPVRVIVSILKVSGFILCLLYLLFLNQLGWIVDLGPRSERARLEAIDQIQNEQVADTRAYPYVDMDIDFRTRASWHVVDPKRPWDDRNHFWVRTRNDYRTADGDNYNTITSFAITADSLQGVADHGIPFCHTGNTGIFDTSLGSWGDRGDPNLMLDRKSARMRRDYETAAIMISALRGTLAHLKIHQSVDGMYGPDETNKPLENSFCSAEGADPNFYSPGEIAAFKSATYTIVLRHAPVVRFRYVGFPVYFRSESDSPDPVIEKSQRREEGFMKITGMCYLWPVIFGSGGCSDPDGSLMYSTTYFGDIFFKDPPLNDPQLEAEKYLLRTATVNFWETAALENGVSDLKSVDRMHDKAVASLAAVLGDKSISRKGQPEMAGFFRYGSSWCPERTQPRTLTLIIFLQKFSRKPHLGYFTSGPFRGRGKRFSWIVVATV